MFNFPDDADDHWHLQKSKPQKLIAEKAGYL